ncbi:thiopeptide-type bacteriocin biosynthesis protein [Natronosporangium hydrolyticum]|uniref:Thiopeptide-type bacteriocin biosynthesis protein n=1 Tax=Natronosporangium hydrolyticum TaxID=2811111 RepID=A0A895YJ57_9ACTN|nr:thiopeptide-type bacteriocin biosynthesis protein [Natronosporangium hydrolyticum]QSB14160.1 thiopeptide-type bacteriocin biosynthesis protein [Natronosporangium hydrolyticum]
MPTDQLIPALPDDLARGVLAVLAGSDPSTTAADLGITSDDLTDAVQLYQAAGLAALEQRAEHEWYDLRLRFPDWHTAEAAAANRLAPALDQLLQEGETAGWWFLRKHPFWRLRLHHADTTAVARLLEQLTRQGILTGWHQTIYEPETAAFGGPAAIDAVHALSCADSRGLLNYVRQPSPALGRREMSMLLFTAFQHAAGLDWFEQGDVFDRVARLRPTPTGSDDQRVETLSADLSSILTANANAHTPLFAPGGPAAFASRWRTAFIQTGHMLGEAAARGRLDRGLRAVIAQIAIFHWNRLGLPARTQGILAHSAATALLGTRLG